MNIAVIFAGGTGIRMNSKSKPKQFLELHGKAIIIYTLEIFDKHPEIDAISIACKDGWEDYLQNLIHQAGIEKVRWIVPGGDTGQMSIFNGISAAYNDPTAEKDSIVLVHDGVRPLINNKLISDNIAAVKTMGNAVTVTPAIETVININDKGEVRDVLDRSICRMAKAPQSFYLSQLYKAHLKAQADGFIDFIDSASLMRHYGYTLHTVDGPMENIKITTPVDYYIFRAIMDIRENDQINGL